MRQTPMVLIWGIGICLSGCASPPPEWTAASGERMTGLYFQFGLTDTQPENWNGAVAVDGGTIRVLHGWRFGRDDRVLDASSWQCRSIEVPPMGVAGDRGNQSLDPSKVSLKDILVHVEGPAAAMVSLSTDQGAAWFRSGEPQYGVSLPLLEGRASVMATVPAMYVSQTGEQMDDDFPAIAAAADGALWTAWTSYTRNKEDHVYARYYNGNLWEPVIRLDEESGDFYRTAVGVSGEDVWVIWSAQADRNFDLYGRKLSSGSWGPTERLTDDPAVDFNHRISSGPDGTLYLVWQSGRGPDYNIYLMVYANGRWSAPLQVSESASNDWEPDVVVDRRGRALIAWDSYEHGDYDVYMRTYRKGALGPIQPLTDSDEFEGYPSLACDSRDRIWIAYHRAIDHWGKDAPLMGEEPHGHAGTRGLRNGTGITLLCYDDGALTTLEVPNPAQMPHSNKGCPELPEIAFDGDGRLWVFFRYLRRNWESRDERWQWDVYGMAWNGIGWTDPMPIPMSYGRNDHRVMAANGSDGRLWLVWPTDERGMHQPAGDRSLYQMRDCNIYAGPLYPTGIPVQAMARQPRAPVIQRAAAPPVGQNRHHQITVDGQSYTLYWGEMHRHTEMSWDGGQGNDGSIFNTYRYALDAAGMDFLGISDHNYGARPAGGGGVYTPASPDYDWWYSEKFADLFFVGRYFIPMYTYERSLSFPHGHRNITALKRGSMVVDTYRDDRGATVRDEELRLFEELKQRDNQYLVISHTSATTMGTDWKFPLPAMEPLVEIYQGCRTNYEYEGAPKSQKPEAGAAYRAGYIWNALAKGLKLGFIASSDHLSTNVSYAAVYAPALTREDIFDSMLKRRAYAAQDHIVLDYRMNGRVLGEEITLKERPRITCYARGTDKIAKVEIVRDNQFIYLAEPGQVEYRVDFTDTNVQRGHHYYYVRVIQENTAMAWASPIWVDYRP